MYGNNMKLRFVIPYLLHTKQYTKTQTTTEWATLIGPKEHRVWVGTDIPGAEIPGDNATDTVVWRDAGTAGPRP